RPGISCGPQSRRSAVVGNSFSPQLARLRVLAKIRHELLGDRPRRTFSDHPLIDLRDRTDLGAGAGDERLVGEVKILPGQNRLVRRVPAPGGELEDQAAGDALQQAAMGRWRAD